MKYFLSLTLLILVCFYHVFAQESPVCSNLKLSAPEKIFEGDLITVEVNLEDNQDIKDVPIRWKVFKEGMEIAFLDEQNPANKPKIIIDSNYDSTKKSKSILIDSSDNSPQIKVEVEVLGEYSTCKSKFTAIVVEKVESGIGCGCFFDEFIMNKLEDAQARLDSFAIQLLTTKNSIGYLQFFVKKGEKISKTKKQIKQVLNYLEKRRGINMKQIVFDLCEGERQSIRSLVLPPGANTSFCNDCKN